LRAIAHGHTSQLIANCGFVRGKRNAKHPDLDVIYQICQQRSAHDLRRNDQTSEEIAVISAASAQTRAESMTGIGSSDS
jgi:hypothetical protein